ncbi:hypothetical protein L9F63_002332, partial [Diploptera punctata]
LRKPEASGQLYQIPLLRVYRKHDRSLQGPTSWIKLQRFQTTSVPRKYNIRLGSNKNRGSEFLKWHKSSGGTIAMSHSKDTNMFTIEEQIEIVAARLRGQSYEEPQLQQDEDMLVHVFRATKLAIHPLSSVKTVPPRE